MHWYKRNLGDYAKKAGRLTMLQHGSYTLLLDACYDREQFPTLEQAIEWTWACTEIEIEAVKFVLERFFKLGADGVFMQDRVLEELLDYQAKADKNKQIAIDRETNRKLNSTNRAQVVNEPPPNQEPITSNQEPVTKNKQTPDRRTGGRHEMAEDQIAIGFASFWSAYPKKTAKPAALKAFRAKKINGELPQILADIAAKCDSADWQKENGQYIPNPATYLNNRRWEDGSAPVENIWAGAI
jgi:uncharacterized protein YdaU (DUF1376 family)